MKKVIDGRFLLVSMLALGLTVGCGGQTTVDTEERPDEEFEPTPPPTADLDRTITVTGCLATGGQPARPGAPTTERPPAAAEGQFVLNVTEPGAAKDRPMAAATKYRLSASADANLKEHVGHTVRVTGTVSEPATGAPGAQRPTEPSGRTSPLEQERTSPGAMMDAPLLMVESIEHVSPRCESQARPTP